MPPVRLAAAIALFLVSLEASAGCGSAFCSLNTDWNAQGAWTEPGGRFDLRYEYIDQDQPRTGTHNLGVGEIREHHDEVRTINRNWIAAFDYTFDANWGVTALVPVVDRSHEHIHNHMGAKLDETWDFTRLGDARIVGRYAFAHDSHESGTFGIQFGVKLPTGPHDVANADGDVAERMLQPGSGTTDGILGVFYSGRLPGKGTWFTDANVMQPFAERDGYKPGARVAFDIGASYPWTDRVSLLLQLNAHWKDRDSGEEAEPEASGGRFVHLSPGVSIGLDEKTRVYGFVQLPIYQYVNGVQLVADWSLAVGLSRRF